MSTPLRTALLTAAALLVTGALYLPQFAHAQTLGTVIVDQGNAAFLGDWGLATPTGVITGNTRLFTSEEKPTGNYALTITPPAGALVTIDVYNDATLTKSFDSRTATGLLGSGGTLRFHIMYDFSLLGTVSIVSTPPGLRATLKGPRGSETVTTPYSNDNMPEGTYSVTYILPTGCRPVAPIARSLQTKGRITFSHDSQCPLLTGGSSSSSSRSSSSSSSSSSTAPTPPPPTRPENPLRVSLTSGSTEITAGAGARLTASVFNRSNMTLRNLTVEYRYDNSRLSVQGVRNGVTGTNQVTWTIASLAPSAKWEESFGIKVAENLENGATLSSTVTVTGDDLQGVPVSQRSATRALSILKTLPATGVPFDLLYIIVGASGSLVVTVAGGLRKMQRR